MKPNMTLDTWSAGLRVDTFVKRRMRGGEAVFFFLCLFFFFSLFIAVDVTQVSEYEDSLKRMYVDLLSSACLMRVCDFGTI